MPKLSVVMIILNEADILKRSLDSVAFADEIIVVDSGSTDGSQAIAKACGAEVIEVKWLGFGPTKQIGVDAASGDWVLSIDADEVVSDNLTKEIKELLAGDSKQDGYYIPRLTMFLGRWIYYCGWYPDPVLRLFKRSVGRFSDAPVHEEILVEGNTGRLKNDLLHYSYPTLDHYFVKMNRYTTLAAEIAFKEGKSGNIYSMMVRPFACFIKHYILRRGLLDGIQGLMISILSACYVFTKYSKLWHLKHMSRNNYNRGKVEQ